MEPINQQAELKNAPIALAVGYHLLQLCQEKNLSLNDLSRLSEVPLTTIKNILNGASRNPGIATIERLCFGLGISLAEFFAADTFHRLQYPPTE